MHIFTTFLDCKIFDSQKFRGHLHTPGHDTIASQYEISQKRRNFIQTGKFLGLDQNLMACGLLWFLAVSRCCCS